MFRPASGLGSTAEAKASKREYEQRRGSARDRGYTARWERARGVFLMRNPFCLGCSAEGRIVVATVVDHIIPHEGDDGLFWDEANWQSSCSWHHDAVKARVEAMWKRGEVGVEGLRLDSADARRVAPPLRCD